MIIGWFGDEDALFFEVELITSDGLELPVDAMFDTGFSGWLAINEQDLLSSRLDLRADTSAADSTRGSRF
jgi:predicted aspartyl protease